MSVSLLSVKYDTPLLPKITILTMNIDKSELDFLSQTMDLV